MKKLIAVLSLFACLFAANAQSSRLTQAQASEILGSAQDLWSFSVFASQYDQSYGHGLPPSPLFPTLYGNDRFALSLDSVNGTVTFFERSRTMDRLETTVVLPQSRPDFYLVGFSAPIGGSVGVLPPGSADWFSSPHTTWLRVENQGITDLEIYFSSRSWMRPQDLNLEVHAIKFGEVPEPSSLMFVAIGALALRFRRRR